MRHRAHYDVNAMQAISFSGCHAIEQIASERVALWYYSRFFNIVAANDNNSYDIIK